MHGSKKKALTSLGRYPRTAKIDSSSFQNFDCLQESTLTPFKLKQISPLQEAINESTSRKDAKIISEWIENDNPNGIEILHRLSQSHTEYAKLIFCAWQDIKIGYEREKKRILDETSRLLKNGEKESIISELEQTLIQRKEESKHLQVQLSEQRNQLSSIQGQITDLHKTLESLPHIDQTKMTYDELISERRSLEAKLDQLLDQFQLLQNLQNLRMFPNNLHY